ncbi:MAG: hypothetical protein ACKV22_31255 [Bryobacteraceae bacterium]
MILIGAGSRGHVHHAAASAAELGGVAGRFHFELGDGFDRKRVRLSPGRKAAAVAAVHQNGILVRQAAGDSRVAGLSDGISARAHLPARGNHSGRQGRQLPRVTAE